MELIYHSNLQLTVKDNQEEAKGENSAYLERFRDNLIKTVQRDSWKFTGQSAQFQGRYRVEREIACQLTINSIAAYDSESYIYSATASGQGDTISAILKKSYTSPEEQFIYHGNKERFYAIDFDGHNRIAASVESENTVARNIAVYKTETNDLINLTDGDTIDDNPSFSKTDSRIFFDSRSIGRDANMRPVAYTESVIFSITESSSLEEIASEKGHDLFMPKNDTDGNLYFIKKPHKNISGAKGASRTFLDTLLFPFWLAYGIAKMLVFLANVAKKSNKKAQNSTTGANPAVENIKSEREMYIQNERIDIENEEKRNLKAGNKTPGFVPKNFELWMRSLDGGQKLIAKGVLAYDITSDNKIIYTNGRYVILIDNEKESAILNDRFIKNVAAKIDKTTLKSIDSSDPFSA